VSPEKRKTALVMIGGGGLRGCVSVGMLKAIIAFLERRNIELKEIAGASVGAMAARYVSNVSTQGELGAACDGLVKIWEEVERRGPSAVFNFSFKNILGSLGKRSLLGNSSLRWLVDGLTTEPVEDPAVKLTCFLRDCDTLEHIRVSSDDPYFVRHPKALKLNKAIIASAALRPFFSPLILKGRWCGDARYLDVGYACEIGREYDYVFLIFNTPFKDDLSSLRTLETFRPQLPRVFGSRSLVERWMPYLVGAFQDIHIVSNALEGIQLRHLLGEAERGRWKTRIVPIFSNTSPGVIHCLDNLRVAECWAPETLSSFRFEPGDITRAMEIAGLRTQEILTAEFGEYL